jgi:hypothetical protein
MPRWGKGWRDVSVADASFMRRRSELPYLPVEALRYRD